MATVNQDKIKLVADVAVYSGNKVLLVKYKDINKYDHQNGWFLPDDLLQSGEHPEECAERILNEQLGIAGCDFHLDHIESFTGNDRSWHLVFHFKTEVIDPNTEPSGDLEKHEWFQTDNLPTKEEVAHHGWALYTIDNMLKKSKTEKVL